MLLLLVQDQKGNLKPKLDSLSQNKNRNTLV